MWLREMLRLLLRVPGVYVRRLICLVRGHREEVEVMGANKRACLWCGWNARALEEETDGER